MKKKNHLNPLISFRLLQNLSMKPKEKCSHEGALAASSGLIGVLRLLNLADK